MNKDNKNFLDRNLFMLNSNIVDPFLNNVFRLEIIDNDNLKMNLELKELIEDTDYKDVWDILIKNAHSVTTSNLEVEYGIQYIGSDRRYVAHKRLDSNIQITFLESSDLKIRRIMDRWIDLIISTNNGGLYFDETVIDLNILSINTNMDTKQKMIYSGVQPITYADITISLENEVNLPAIVVTFNFVEHYMDTE